MIENPNLKNRTSNRYAFYILKELSREEGKIMIRYIKLVRNKDDKSVDVSRTQKLIKRMSKDKLIKIKKDKNTRNKYLFITEEGKKCLNLLLQQPHLKE